MFTLIKKEKTTKARRGRIETAHGTIETPFFMPVGTNSSVKTLTNEDLREIGAPLMLCNTYHMYIRPDLSIIEQAGGLHKFIGWDRPMLTDSGGYQVFSLSKIRKITDDGVKFSSHLDGAPIYFTPEKVIDIERTLGADMIMPLDECAPYPCGRKEAENSVRRTTLWAKRSREHFLNTKQDDKKQFLFGIVQGSTYEDLRKRSCEEILNIGFDGYAIGGVSVGESVHEMFEALDWVEPSLPEDKPRYFMGIGYPDQIVKAVGRGMDMFDCVLPTRFGRHATAFTSEGRKILTNLAYKSDFSPIDPACDCIVCRKYSRSYIRNLCRLGEITGLKLVTYHNLYFYVKLMERIRQAIEQDRYPEFEQDFLVKFGSELI